MLKLAIKRLFALLLIVNASILSTFRTTLNPSDPNPIYTSQFPFEPVFNWRKDYMKGWTNCKRDQRISIAVSPFTQRANKGTNINKQHSELGDLKGRWNMIAVLPFNDAPTEDNSFNPANTLTDIPSVTQCFDVKDTVLIDIRNNLLQCIESVFYNNAGEVDPYPDQLKTVEGLLALQGQEELFGYFTVPIKYRKNGVRFHMDAVLFCGLGFSCDFGVSNVSQTATFVDLTSTSTCFSPSGCATSSGSCPTSTPIINCLNPFGTSTISAEQWTSIVSCVHRQLMDNLKAITDAIGLDTCDYNKTAIEDIHLEMFWRNAYCININGNKNWSSFLVIPFWNVGYTRAAAPEANSDMAFSLSSGNNGFDEIDFLAGIGIDFQNSIEVGGDAGFTHFRCRNACCYRVPTNDYQQEIFPYETNVTIQPGDTWHFSVYMNSRYFLEHWSFWAQYAYINHNKDKVWLQRPIPSIYDVENGITDNDVYKPCLLECTSDWTVQILNAGLNYDLSPNFSLGLFAQIPLVRVNAYRSTTFMANLYAAF